MQSFHTSGIGPIRKQQGISLHLLSKWNKQLDNQKIKCTYQQEQLKKQKKLTKLKTETIYKDISQIQGQTLELSKKLQEEKTKYEKLTLVIKNLQKQNYNQKLQKYQDILNKKQPDQFQEQKKILQQRQKNLQKILEKLNTSEFEISKKYQLIRSLRSQRSVHSNIFDNLQKQHFDVEFYYKQLLIERSLMEKQYDRSVNHFNHIHHTSTNQMSKITAQLSRQQQNINVNVVDYNQQRYQRQRTQNQIKKTQKQIKQEQLKLQQLKQNRSSFHNSNRSVEKSKSKKQTNYSSAQQKNATQMRKNTYQKKVKQILDLIQLQTFDQFLKSDVKTKNIQNQTYFQTTNEIYEQIFDLQNKNKQLERAINQSKHIKQHSVNIKKVQLQSQIFQFDKETHQTKKEIIKFKQQFQKLILNSLSGNKNDVHSSQNNNNKSSVQIQNPIVSLLLTKKASKQQNSTYSQVQALQTSSSFIQSQQKLKSLMINFNDDLLQTFMKKNKTLIYRNKLLRKKSLLGLKNKKTSNFSQIDKKVKILRTQTQGSLNSSVSVANMESLQAILNMHANISQKVQRNQKIDKLTIMTEDDFIQQSKRIIRQANKKKSQYITTPSVNRK